MRQIFKTLFLVFIAIFFMFLGVVIYNSISKGITSEISSNSELIQEQLKNVSKLVVTEAQFSQVMSYKDQQKYFMNLLTFNKKALVVVSAKATVSYDLSALKYQIDSKNKVVQLIYIPKPEIAIYPEFKIYDVEQSAFNPFVGEDYNKINQIIKNDISKKIEKSTLKTNAENRLISELSKILILTNTLGWKLEYQGNIIDNEQELIYDLKL
ncbi:DUF4230 domain-containing protein [Myroides sp. LJL119]